MKPEILHEDPNVIVLSKPAGLLAQGGDSPEERQNHNLVDWLRNYLGRNYVGLIHRLDRNTSGLMVVAKRTKSARRLTEALQAGKICRVYRAWLIGEITAEQNYSHFLKKDPKLNRVKVLTLEEPGAKRALTRLRPIRTSKFKSLTITLVEIVLETGRSHQIRAQCAFEGHPVLGDQKYALPESSRESSSLGRLALHSFKLSFPHPIGGEKMEFEQSLPHELEFS